MARIPALPGITAEILPSGSNEPLTEYPDKTKPEDINQHLHHITTTNFVQTPAPGTPFSFKLRVGPPYRHSCPMLAFYFVINGIDDGPSQLCGEDHLDDHGVWECVVPGWEVTDDEGTRLRRFRFMELVVHEDFSGPRIPAEEEIMKKVGTIDVQVYRQKETRIVKPKKNKLREVIKEIPQKLIKGQAISRTVDLGEPEKLDEETVYHTSSLMDGEDHPIAIFRFKYRSKADLQAELIIPRSPSPEPPSLPTFEELPEDEVVDLALAAHMRAETGKRVAARIQRATYVARRFEGLSEEEKTKLARVEWSTMNGGSIVKLEHSRANTTAKEQVSKRKRPLNVSTSDAGKVVIDLSADDDELVDTDDEHQDLVPEDDEVVFVEARRVKEPRESSRVKTEK